MATFTGSAKADIFAGTSEADTVDGNGGNDNLSGGDGNDLITGGAGADKITGGAGDDSLASADAAAGFGQYFGRGISTDTGAERDVLVGGDGSDHFYIGYGDSADGGTGSYYGDYLSISLLGASSGVTFDLSQDTLTIGGGKITGIENLTWLQGSNYDDVLYAGDRSGGYSEFTTVLGMAGNDHIIGGYYTSYMDGGDGDDTIDIGSAIYAPEIRGGAGSDTINAVNNNGAKVYGDAGADTIYTNANAWGGSGNDHIVVSFGYYGNAAYGEDGDDWLESVGDGAVMLVGGAGEDQLVGGSQTDYLYADGDAPNPIGLPEDNGAEHDTVTAGGGDDRISAGFGDDVDGGEGNDAMRLSLAGASTGLTFSIADIVSGEGTFHGATIRGIEVLTGLTGTRFADRITVAGSILPPIVDAGAGADTFVAAGEAVQLLGGDGNDRLIATKAGGYFDGGAGVDTAQFAKARAGVTVSMVDGFGGGFIGEVALLANVENVTGSKYADKIIGDAFNNTLNGGAGADRLEGGAGDDTYILTDLIDTIVELNGGGTDTVRSGLSNTLAGRVENLTLTGKDDVEGTGNAQGNVILGNAGANVLTGLGGDDVLWGGAGLDSLDGGDGADVYLLKSGAEQTAAEIHDSGTSGTDELRFGGATATVYVPLAGNTGIEAITIGTGTGAEADTRGKADIGIDASAVANALILTGNAGDNALTGTAFGDTIHGGRGKDTILGLDGADLIDGGDSADVIDGGAGIDSIEGGAGNDRIAGDVDNDVLAGGAGIDTIDGGAGDDTIDGGSDGDKLSGGDGADHIDGGDGNDMIDGGFDIDTIVGGDGDDTIDGGFGADILDGGIGKDTILGGADSDTLHGGDGVDRVDGGQGDDTLDGGSGDDALSGGAGADTYYVDDAGDRTTELADQGIDTVITSIDWTNADNIENLVLGDGASAGTGNALANQIEGNAQANNLDGGAGNDTLLGGDGNDVLKGGTGSDRMEGGAGDDTYLIEGNGDTLVEGANAGFDRAFGGDSITLGSNVEVGSLTGTAGVSLTGSVDDNLLGGNSGDNAISGGGGADSLFGHAGADTLNGGEGNDFLYGGLGVDTLTGGAGIDQFVIATAASQGVDKIKDFVSGTDKLLVVNDFVSGFLLPGGFVNGTSAHDEDDIAIYDKASGNLYVDYDANGPQAKVLLASFTPGTTLAASDIVLVLADSFAGQVYGAEALLLL